MKKLLLTVALGGITLVSASTGKVVKKVTTTAPKKLKQKLLRKKQQVLIGVVLEFLMIVALQVGLVVDLHWK
ncbi:hypothetical protein LDL59_06475 [Kaistella anthropi]|nr:hypothetical protein [Kaistella anthropi]